MVDIRAELEQYDWIRPTWTHEKLIAASPFRNDSTPSFYVYLVDTPTAAAGSWGDSGAIDPQWAKGGIVKLLAFLRGESEWETAEYLGMTDEFDRDINEPIRLDSVRILGAPKPLNMRLLDDLDVDYSYLEKRGISPPVQREACVKYDPSNKAIAIPWFDGRGRLVAVKYRRTDSKAFWYAKEGRPIRSLIYGIDRIYRTQEKTAVLVEAEIDALYLMEAGHAAIASGGATFNEEKAEMSASPIERIVIMADHDDAGQRMKRRAVELLTLYGIDVEIAGYPFRYKDPNEIGDLALVGKYVRGSRKVGNFNQLCRMKNVGTAV